MLTATASDDDSIRVDLTGEQAATIRAAAAELGLTVEDFLRVAAIERAHSTVPQRTFTAPVTGWWQISPTTTTVTYGGGAR